MRGAALESGKTVRTLIIDLMKSALDKGAVKSILVPFRGPDHSFPWTLINDISILEETEPLPPVMSVQGAKALASFAQSPAYAKVLAILRPCEARAAIELSKLEQINLNSIILLTMDCPGVVPLSKFITDNTLAPDIFNPQAIRPLCGQCIRFTSEGDVCLSGSENNRMLIPLTPKGQDFLNSLDIKAELDDQASIAWVNDLRIEREKARSIAVDTLKNESGGLNGLLEIFSGCIGCRNCQTVCPLCYCRLCFIDMKDRRCPASSHLEHAAGAGAARLVSNTLLFHIGRMAHMSLSCVSCGMCEDACPSDIQIGRLVSMVSASTAEIFEYESGSNPDGPLPLNTFHLDELHEFED